MNRNGVGAGGATATTGCTNVECNTNDLVSKVFVDPLVLIIENESTCIALMFLVMVGEN